MQRLNFDIKYLPLIIGGSFALLFWVYTLIGSNDIEQAGDLSIEATKIPAVAESRCSSPSMWPSITTIPIEESSFRAWNIEVMLQDRTPIQGLCITVLLDAVPVYPLSYVSSCRTGLDGRCTLTVPSTLLRLHFDETTIEDMTLDLSVNEIVYAAVTPTDNLAYYIAEGEKTASATLVVVPRTESTFTIKNARPNSEGQLIIQNPDIPDWAGQIID